MPSPDEPSLEFCHVAVQFVGGFIVTALMFPLIILGAGGNWQWVEGWLFALWFDVMVLANMTYLGEEQMLQTELKGYAGYERKVRYRLIPYLW